MVSDTPAARAAQARRRQRLLPSASSKGNQITSITNQMTSSSAVSASVMKTTSRAEASKHSTLLSKLSSNLPPCDASANLVSANTTFTNNSSSSAPRRPNTNSTSLPLSSSTLSASQGHHNKISTRELPHNKAIMKEPQSNKNTMTDTTVKTSYRSGLSLARQLDEKLILQQEKAHFNSMAGTAKPNATIKKTGLTASTEFSDNTSRKISTSLKTLTTSSRTTSQNRTTIHNQQAPALPPPAAGSLSATKTTMNEQQRRVPSSSTLTPPRISRSTLNQHHDKKDTISPQSSSISAPLGTKNSTLLLSNFDSISETASSSTLPSTPLSKPRPDEKQNMHYSTPSSIMPRPMHNSTTAQFEVPVSTTKNDEKSKRIGHETANRMSTKPTSKSSSVGSSQHVVTGNHGSNEEMINGEDDDDDNLFSEEDEPLAGYRSNGEEIMNSSKCLHYGDFIQIRSLVNSTPPISVYANLSEKEHKNGDKIPKQRLAMSDDKTFEASQNKMIYVAAASTPTTGRTMRGSSSICGFETDLFCILRCGGDTISSMENDSLVKSSSFSSDLVRYGDIISLRSEIASNRLLGIQGNGQEAGFFRTASSQAEKWEILYGGKPNRMLCIGKYAVARTKNKKRMIEQKKLVDSSSATILEKAIVCSGDSVILRNIESGGIFSLNYDYLESKVIVLTDSYNSDATTDSTGSSVGANKATKSLLSRVQRNGILETKANHTFQLIHACVPKCPIWWLSSISGETRRNANERMYLDNPRFTSTERCNTSASSTKFMQAIQICDFQTQEKLLVDEVIGSMMGLEGNYIQIQNRELVYCPTTIKKFCLRKFFFNSEKNSIDKSLRSLIERILPMSTALINVKSFVTSHLCGYEYGTVMQALCEGLDRLLEDYLTYITQVNTLFYRSISANGSSSFFSMNILYVHVKPYIDRMKILQHVAVASYGFKGGALLNSLRSLMTSDYAGDAIGRQTLQYLLDHASVPYMNMLKIWLDSGDIHDPYDEFLIKCFGNTELSIDFDADDWKGFFKLQEEHVLDGIISTSQMKQKILTTGKHWNAVRYCRRKIGTSNEERRHNCSLSVHCDRSEKSTLRYSMDPSLISSYVNRMYQSASHQLLRLLFEEFNLLENLRTVKRYLLLDQGDFFVHFLDVAEDELLKELTDVSRGRIQNWLSMSLQLTENCVEDTDWDRCNTSQKNHLQPTAAWRPTLISQSIRCSFTPNSLVDQLDALSNGGMKGSEPKTPSRHAYGIVNKSITGIESLILDFPVQFPTSLVLSSRSLEKYQLLFRHLFFCKHVERRLVGIWLDQQMMKELQSLRRSLGPTYCLRQRMLHFMQNLIYYMMFEVIEPSWLKLETEIKTNETNESSESIGEEKSVDHILDLHDRFLSQVLEECLLTNRNLIRTLTKLMTTCLLFSDQIKRFMEETRIYDDNSTAAMNKRLSKLDKSSGLRETTVLRKKGNPHNSFKAIARRQERENRHLQQASRVERELSNASYKRMISRFDEVFNDNLREFMMQLKSDSSTDDQYHASHRINLCQRLDYNGYYLSGSMSLN